MRNRDDGIAAAFGPSKILFVTPAAPGFYVVKPITENNGRICEASCDPVVGFALDELGCSYPVSMCDGLQNTGDPAVLCPDGQVRTYDGTWDSLDDWLAEAKRVKAKTNVTAGAK